MHHLARCTLSAGDRVLDGYITSCADGDPDHAHRAGGRCPHLPAPVTTSRSSCSTTCAARSGTTAGSRWRARRRCRSTASSSRRRCRSARSPGSRSRRPARAWCTSADGDTRPVTFLVLDISAHGVRISTSAEIAVGERIVFRFPTRDRVVPLDAEVLRSFRPEGRPIQYGCRFVGLSERDTDVDVPVRAADAGPATAHPTAWLRRPTRRPRTGSPSRRAQRPDRSTRA